MVQENLTGIRVVKSFVREDYEEEKFAKRNGDLKESSMRAFGMVVINMPVMMLVVYSTIIAVMWFGGKMVYAGTLPVGDLTAFFTYITQILMSLMMVSMMFMMMTRSIACAKRIVEVLDEAACHHQRPAPRRTPRWRTAASTLTMCFSNTVKPARSGC